ncbi:MAG: GIY-YIG nuclease family protein [Cyclobacteriaceae bacterium]|nr:GIY-YIG nuclease family protein [Cyclobacteriaceae bacterium]
MFFVYILVSGADGSFYIGQTNNLPERLRCHNAGLEKYTRPKTSASLLAQSPVWPLSYCGKNSLASLPMNL